MEGDRYTYRVTWSAEDGEYLGTVAEFPSLSWLDADEDEAFRGIRRLVRDVVADMEDTGEPVPEPLSQRRYSGKFQVRVTPEMHRRLAIEAAEAKVSINRLVNAKLSAG
ncbi:MAG: type II toxin-antitoxin system HicB family antitoxin [Magnetospirillum sp.]|nr:type II toxin-antitoxin system HicB family antitoxin [Magnetospirillum sp.]